MPTLPYPPDLSIGRQHDWILANMLFPDSPGTAFTFFARNWVKSELNGLGADEEVKLTAGFVRALAFGAGVDELVKLENYRGRAGVTAGLVLLMIFFMANGKYDRPSINKAAHIIEEIAAFKKKQNMQLGHFSDRKEIFAAWKLMKNSAHFWAALEPIDWLYSDVPIPRVEKTAREFLRLACSLRQFGCNFHESHSKGKKSLLDSDSSLRLPDEFESEAYAMNEVPVPTFIQDILKKYRAPKAV